MVQKSCSSFNRGKSEESTTCSDEADRHGCSSGTGREASRGSSGATQASGLLSAPSTVVAVVIIFEKFSASTIDRCLFYSIDFEDLLLDAPRVIYSN